MRNTRLATDIGGTFTDVAAFDERSGRLLLGKALSTPRRLVDGISDGVGKAGAAFADASLFLHGSTVAINTVLERTGARAALLITEGFRDIYEIGRINRPDAYNLYFRKHIPLIERASSFEVRERMTAEGDVLVPLDEASVHAACDHMIAKRVEAVRAQRRVQQVGRDHHPGHETAAEAVPARDLVAAGLSGELFSLECNEPVAQAIRVMAEHDFSQISVTHDQRLVGSLNDAQVTTLEGLSADGRHPLQVAWQDVDVPQCGYCQAGQIMSAAALLTRIAKPTDADIDTAMTGNLCRCGTYLRIREAIHRAANATPARSTGGR